MDIKGLSAIQKYAAARPATAVEDSPAQAMRAAATDFATTLAQTEQTAQTAMISDADPHALVTALAQTELAVETAVSVRNKMVEAYQEILRMPV